MNNKTVIGIACAIALSGAAMADEGASIYDRIWDSATLVKDSTGPIEKVAFVGRLQGDAYSFGGKVTHNEDLVWRRLRLGFKASLIQNLLIHVEGDFNLNETEDWDEFSNRITDTYVGWAPSKQTKFKFGKQSAGFTLDGATSSKKLLVPERSIVAGNLWFGTEYFTGAAVYGDVENISYKVGGFSSSGEAGFGHFDSGYFALLSAGTKVGEDGSLRLDYVYNDTDYDSKYGYGTKKLDHVLALVYKQKLGEKFGIWADVAGGFGNSDQGMSDLFGVDIMPYYDISDTLQLVLQYAGVTSLDSEVDVSMSRYAYRNVGKEKVETAHNLLLGFNWYLYGHKLKWQNAVEYNHGKNLDDSGNDYNGYGLTSAVRISW
ncbi:porin [Pontiellaceae bacterium B12227]|nr:porin [Pontiellaceae bacterium B12227]